MTEPTVTDPEARARAGEPEAALEIRDLHSGYGNTTVLRGVSLALPKSGVTALLGANGAGKTTLLKTVSGLLPVRSGQIRLRDRDVTRLSAHRRTEAGLRLVPEGRGVYRSLTVRENLTIQARRGQESKALERATAAFPILGKRLRQVAGTMSGGEQQMLALSAAYARESSVIMVDEPSMGLAPVVVDLVFEFLDNLGQLDVSLLVVDQYAHRVLRMAQEAHVLRRGELVFSGAATELLGGDLFERYLGSAEPAA